MEMKSLIDIEERDLQMSELALKTTNDETGYYYSIQ